MTKERNEYKTEFSFNEKIYSLKASYSLNTVEMKLKENGYCYPLLSTTHRDINRDNFLEHAINSIMGFFIHKKYILDLLKECGLEGKF